MGIAQKSDWKNFPLPKEFETIPLKLHFSSGEMQKIQQGFIPSLPEEKWFLYFSDNVLYCHRSWTGYCVYEIHFQTKETGYTVTYVLANRDPNQYTETDPEVDRHKIFNIIKTYLFETSYSHEGICSPITDLPDFVRIIPAQRFIGTPTLEYRPYAFYTDATSLEGETIAECYRLVLGLTLPPRENPLRRENRTPFLWDQSYVSLDSPLTKFRKNGRGKIRCDEYSEKHLNSVEFIVIKVAAQLGQWHLDAFPATWCALAYILSDAKRMGGQPASYHIQATDYAKSRLHALFCDLLAKNNKDRLALMKSKTELKLDDFSKLSDYKSELDYYNYISMGTKLLKEITDLFGISYWCWHGGGYIGWPEEPLCRLYFLGNRMLDDMNISIMKGKDLFKI